MFDSLMSNTSLPLLEQIAQFGERRHEVLTGNLANLDTPDYKTRDLPVDDFQKALQKAVQQKNANQSGISSAGSVYRTRKTPVEHITGDLFQAREAPVNNLTFHDNNNRSVEDSVAEMTKNYMMQNYAVQLMTAQFNLMQSVISGRP